jgi:cysteine-S-conjugate beta-lyase
MSFDFDTWVDRRHTASVKWDKYRGRDVLPLWVADMDFPSPPAVLAALHQRVDHGLFGYSAAPEELIEVTLALLHREYGWTVDPAWIIWLPGLVSGIHLCCRAVGQAGDEIITTIPIYPPFLTAPVLSERTLVTVPLTPPEDHPGDHPRDDPRDHPRNHWEMDFDRIAAAVTPRTRVMLLCNPHNPVGRIFTRSELEALARLCLEHDLVLCSDEIHCQLLLDADRPHLPAATLGPEVAARTITLLAPSKTYNIAGLGCSFAVIPDAGLRRRFERVRSGIVPWVNLLGYTAALAAYRDGQAWLAALCDYLRGNRDLVVDEIARMPGLRAARPEATYLAWIDARGLGVADPAAHFEEHGVGLSDGREFGTPGFVRLNFGCPRSLLREAMNRMARAAARPRDGNRQ